MKVEGDDPLKLDAPLRPSLWRIRFSPNGRFVVAQDEQSINVLDVDGGKALFRIDAPEAAAAQFTPDSENVIFQDIRLRVERWHVSTGRRVDVKELVVYDGCDDTLLSQDGRKLVCTNFNLQGGQPRVSLRMVDVASGKTFLDRPDFFRLGLMADRSATLQLAFEVLRGQNIVTMIASPGGRYLLVVVEGTAMGYDLEKRQEVVLGGRLKSLHFGRMSFMGPDTLFIAGDKKGEVYKAQVVSFPDGRVLKETVIGGEQIYGASNSQFLLVSPMKDYAVGLLDPLQTKFVAAAKLPGMDAWEKSVAVEDVTGGVQIEQPGSATKRIPILYGPLPQPRAAVFSPDGKYLALSVRTRGEIWDLEDGKKMVLMPPFRSAWIDEDDNFFAQFPKYMSKDAVERRIALKKSTAKDLSAYEAEEGQFHNLRLSFRPMGKDKDTTHHATLVVKSMETEAVQWSRDYTHEMPAVWTADDNRMVLAWDLSNETARDEIKGNVTLKKQMKNFGAKQGLLLETVVPGTGAPLQQVILPEVKLTGGVRDDRRATISGDFALARDENGKTTIYRLSDGGRIGDFVGTSFATDAASGFIAARHGEDEVLLVDERSGQELKRFTLGARVLVGQIVGTKEKTLLVLTADQVVHRLPLTADELQKSR